MFPAMPKDEFMLPFSNHSTPTVVLADEAFGIKTYLMQPFSGRNLDVVNVDALSDY